MHKWDTIKKAAHLILEKKNLHDVYKKRLTLELKEIEKQGLNSYWEELINNKEKKDSNPNNLILPWLFGIVKEDPITNPENVITSTRFEDITKLIEQHGEIPKEIIRDNDCPDIDIDCLPLSRNDIKDYANTRFGLKTNDEYGSVCSVGTWSTIKLKSALKAIAASTSFCSRELVERISTDLPDTVDDMKELGLARCKGKIVNPETGKEQDCGKKHNSTKCPHCGSVDTESPTIGKILEEFEDFRNFNNQYPQIVDYAVRLVGKVSHSGKHAGALIIADRPLFGEIPMEYDSKNDQWKSIWTEGSSTQLSKFGFIKWDILGLKNLMYLFECSRLIEENYGISFGEKTDKSITLETGEVIRVPSMLGWEHSDPFENHGGFYYTRKGEKIYIDLNDKKALETASSGNTWAIFQFDTPTSTRVVKNGVKDFRDMTVICALSHPGPLQSVPEYIRRRDDKHEEWRKQYSEEINEILGDTYNIIVYQEQLQQMWVQLGGFTSSEAQAARKAVAKKWTDKLRDIERKWMEGASKKIGEKSAAEWWELMQTFGRYAFNRCLDKDTIIRDPLTNEQITLQELHDQKRTDFHLLSYNTETKETFIDNIVEVIDSGEQEVYEIEFDNGETMMLTMNHKLLCVDGEYHTIQEIINQDLEITSYE